MFEQTLGLRDVENVYINEAKDFPTFPCQLGCQGFVVIDRQHRFVDLCTSPMYNRAGQAAFDAVERILAQLPIRSVKLVNLSASPELNGTTCEVVNVAARQLPEGRIAVKLPDGCVLAVKEENVVDERREVAEPTDAFDEKQETVVFDENACCSSGTPCSTQGCSTPKSSSSNNNSISLPSVGHKAMDAEHADLEKVMADLSTSKSVHDMESLRDFFEEHSEHEEKLLKRVGFGGTGQFSALESHAQDHRHILAMADAALGEAGDDDVVPASCVNEVISAIVAHANNFDKLYADSVQVA